MSSHNVQVTDRSKGEVMNSVMVMLSVITEVHQAVANSQANSLVKADDGMQSYVFCTSVHF